MYDELMDKKPVKKSLFSFGMKKKKDDEVRETEESVDKNAEVTDDGMEMTAGNNLKEFFGDSAVGDSDRPTEERESVQRRQVRNIDRGNKFLNRDDCFYIVCYSVSLRRGCLKTSVMSCLIWFNVIELRL